MANFKLIKEIAREKGITVRQIAKGLGIKDASVHHLIKTGSTSTSTLEGIAKILDVSAGIFFDGYPSPSEEAARIHELERDNAHLRQLLEEKERTIRILEHFCPKESHKNL